MCKNVHRSFLYSSLKLETNQTSSIGGWLNEMSYSQNEASGTHTDISMERYQTERSTFTA